MFVYLAGTRGEKKERQRKARFCGQNCVENHMLENPIMLSPESSQVATPKILREKAHPDTCLVQYLALLSANVELAGPPRKLAPACSLISRDPKPFPFQSPYYYTRISLICLGAAWALTIRPQVIKSVGE